MKLMKLIIILILTTILIQACRSPKIVEKTTYIHDTVIMKHIVSDTVMDSAIVIKNNIIHDTILIVETRYAKAQASLKNDKLSIQLTQKDTILKDTVKIKTQTNINTFKNEGSNTTKNITFIVISTFLFTIIIFLLFKKLIR